MLSEDTEVTEVCYVATMHVRPYEKLIAWQESHKLCLWIYMQTKDFPLAEKFRLVSQMCRSAYSVPTNITEGSNKASKKEREHFYETSACSLEELHYQCILARDLRYMHSSKYVLADDHIQRVSYLIMKLRASLK